MINNNHEEQENANEESFADLLAASLKKPGQRLAPGDKVEARVLAIGAEAVFLDIGSKGEGVIDRKELVDAEGKLTVQQGDMITAYFTGGSRNELRFTTRITGGSAASSQLSDAYRAGIPVDGLVEKEIKGGYEIKLAGSTRAFCPFSQISLRRAEKPEEFIGRHLTFKIAEYAEGGRNIIVSHRAIEELEKQQQKEELKNKLQPGMVVQGTVRSLQKFGAFVDIGGVEGLLPVSEIGWGRVEKVEDELSVGQTLEVAIKQLDWENNRISLSMRDILADPWKTAASSFAEGSFHYGKVARLAPFGAFITLAPGIDGLIHISKLGAGKRINHPREVLKEGESVEVKVEAVDVDNRKISLSLAGIARAEDEEAATLEDFRKAASQSPKGMGTLGEMLKAQMEKKKR